MRRELFVRLFAQAITANESAPGSLCERLNNPGCLRTWKNREQVDGFAQFETRRQGEQALRQQIRRNIFRRGLSIREFFEGSIDYAGYSPASDGNDPKLYAERVAAAIRDARIFGRVSVEFQAVAKMEAELADD